MFLGHCDILDSIRKSEAVVTSFVSQVSQRQIILYSEFAIAFDNFILLLLSRILLVLNVNIFIGLSQSVMATSPAWSALLSVSWDVLLST